MGAIYDDVKITINLNKLVDVRARILTQYEDYSNAVATGEHLDENDVDRIAVKLRETLTWDTLYSMVDSAIFDYMGLKDPNKPNFVNYMFKEDMISDGIENCVQYIHNFNPDKSKNPFAYFTQIIHYAFLRRIQREKRQLDIKNKILERSGYDEVFSGDKVDGMDSADYNSIKDAVHSKLRY